MSTENDNTSGNGTPQSPGQSPGDSPANDEQPGGDSTGPSESDSDDRRRALRQPINFVVEYDGADDFILDYTENLSAGGTFVTTKREFEIGQPVRLSLSFPGLLQTVEITGTVRWVRRATADDRGVGIEFDPGEPQDELARIIEKVTNRDPQVVSRLIKVLVAEDNPHVSQLIREGLQGSGRRQFGDRIAFSFRTAQNGHEALELLEAESFDALIVDVYLPVIDGLAVIQQVRDNPRIQKVPIVATSAGGPQTGKYALDAGADLFLPKPMRLREIIHVMKSLLDFGE